MIDHIAIDIGASSGRVVVLSDAKFQEIHRFENRIVDGCWDVESLYESILVGLHKVKTDKATVSIDTWGCDVVYLDKFDKCLGNPRSYRYCDTDIAVSYVSRYVKPQTLYTMTGTQFQPFNTLYQLIRDQMDAKLEKASSMMFMAEYLMFRLTGVKHQELTMASTSQLLNVHTKDWHWELIDLFQLPRHLFQPLRKAGDSLGPVKVALPYEAQGVVTGSHDTASAFFGAKDRENIIVSCGTWSLVGIHTDLAYIDDASFEANFTHEIGTDGRIRFLKNIPGMWVFETVRKFFGSMDYDVLINEARLHPNTIRINLQDDRFLMPESMVETINTLCQETNQPTPQNRGAYMYCVINSLAHEICDTVDQIEAMTAMAYRGINVVGGGSKNQLLIERIAEISNKPVMAGPVEASIYGNMYGSKAKENVF